MAGTPREREARRDLREPRATEFFGSQSRAVLDIRAVYDYRNEHVWADQIRARARATYYAGVITQT